MTPFRQALLPILLLPALAACTETKDLSPPPLNPHPREAVRVRIDFDKPDDAMRYRFSMSALYQNQQRECGYIPNKFVGNFRYPNGYFDIPDQSPTPDHAEFVIYLDRFDQPTCNWEFASPGLELLDTRTGWVALSFFGTDEQLSAGAVTREACQFIDGRYPNSCRIDEPLPDVPHRARVSYTLTVSKDSAPLRPSKPGFFSHFVQPVTPPNIPNDASSH